MRTLILVSQTPIVIQIFKLVCKKINLNLEILENTQTVHKVDMIIVDKDLINNKFQILKTFSKRIGAISNEELTFEMANDFLVPLPFLPSSLQQILEIQIENIIKQEKSKTYVSNIDIETSPDPIIAMEEEMKNHTDPALKYLEDLADGIAHNIDDENDDSLITISSIDNGGVLDFSELSTIEDLIELPDILPEEIEPTHKKTVKEFAEKNEDTNDWSDLASIIDEAIDEVNTTNVLGGSHNNTAPVELILNNYALAELSPLLNMLDQDVINKSTEGQAVNITLKLG